MRRGIAILFAAAMLRADSAQDAEEVIRRAAAALRDGNAPALWLLFDSKMPGYAHFRQASQALLDGAQAESTVNFVKDQGDDRSRTLELDWKLDITGTQRVVSLTVRHEKVVCEVARRGDAWKIVNFQPADFFAATHAAEVWDTLSNAAIALNSTVEDRPVSPAAFLGAFDSKMPGYDRLVDGITALTRLGPVESSVELVKNEGDDYTRKVEADWSLQVLNKETGIYLLRKEQHIQFQLEWQGKHWRVTGVDPLIFFSTAGS